MGNSSTKVARCDGINYNNSTILWPDFDTSSDHATQTTPSHYDDDDYDPDKYEYQSVDADMNGKWYIATIRHNPKELDIFEFKIDASMFGKWHKLTNIFNNCIEPDYKYFFDNAKQNKCYVTFTELYTYTFPRQFLSCDETYDLQTKWFGNYQQNIIKVTESAIYKYDKYNQKWIITMMIPSFINKSFKTKFNSEHGKLFIFDINIFAVFDVIKLKWNFIKSLNRSDRKWLLTDFQMSYNADTYHFDHDNSNEIRTAVTDKSLNPGTDHLHYDEQLNAILKSTVFTYQYAYTTSSYGDGQFTINNGTVNDNTSISYRHYTTTSLGKEHVLIAIEKLNRIYRFENKVIRWIRIDDEKAMWKYIAAPWQFLYGTRNIHVILIEAIKCIVLVIIRDMIYYCDLLNEGIIKNDKLLDKEFDNLLGIAYDDRYKKVHFMRENFNHMIIVDLKDLIPIQARKDELVNGYIRYHENVNNVVIPMSLIELIVCYYPIFMFEKI